MPTLVPTGRSTRAIDIACADLDADGIAELVVGAGPGRAPEVQVYTVGLSTLTQRATFLAYEDGFRGGVRVAAGSYAGRPGWLGAFQIATTPGPGQPVDLRLWEATGAPVAQANISSATKGVLPTLGDANGDGQLDLVVAPDDGRPELVRIFDVDTGNVIGDVPGGLPAFPVGVRIALGVLTVVQARRRSSWATVPAGIRACASSSGRRPVRCSGSRFSRLKYRRFRRRFRTMVPRWFRTPCRTSVRNDRAEPV